MATQEAHVQTWAPGNAAFTSINAVKDPICEAETRVQMWLPSVLLPFPLQLQHLPGTSGTGVPLSPRSSGNTSLGWHVAVAAANRPRLEHLLPAEQSPGFSTMAPSRGPAEDWQLDPRAAEGIPESSN